MASPPSSSGGAHAGAMCFPQQRGGVIHPSNPGMVIRPGNNSMNHRCSEPCCCSQQPGRPKRKGPWSLVVGSHPPLCARAHFVATPTSCAPSQPLRLQHPGRAMSHRMHVLRMCGCMRPCDNLCLKRGGYRTRWGTSRQLRRASWPRCSTTAARVLRAWKPGDEPTHRSANE